MVRRCYVFEVGRIAFSGTPDELGRHPALTRAYLGATAR